MIRGFLYEFHTGPGAASSILPSCHANLAHWYPSNFTRTCPLIRIQCNRQDSQPRRTGRARHPRAPSGFDFVDSDSGERDREQGVGAGAGPGYRRSFGWNREGWLLGGRLDFWVAEIDGEDDLAGGGKLEGSSDVAVLRPGLGAGYSLWISDAWHIDWLTMLGLDLYLDTDGEDVGSDQVRLSIGLAFRYGF